MTACRKEKKRPFPQEGQGLWRPPTLEEELRDCLADLRRNQLLFELEVEEDLIDQRIYERKALLCRYHYLQTRVRAAGLRTLL